MMDSYDEEEVNDRYEGVNTYSMLSSTQQSNFLFPNPNFPDTSFNRYKSPGGYGINDSQFSEQSRSLKSQ